MSIAQVKNKERRHNELLLTMSIRNWPPLSEQQENPDKLMNQDQNLLKSWHITLQGYMPIATR